MYGELFGNSELYQFIRNESLVTDLGLDQAKQKYFLRQQDYYPKFPLLFDR
jgi:hypothetical protein